MKQFYRCCSASIDVESDEWELVHAENGEDAATQYLELQHKKGEDYLDTVDVHVRLEVCEAFKTYRVQAKWIAEFSATELEAA